jgi:hypothetical protein
MTVKMLPVGRFAGDANGKISHQRGHQIQPGMGRFSQDAQAATEQSDNHFKHRQEHGGKNGFQRRRFLLIVPPKLFIGGKESRRNHSPQPTVNNFAPPKKFTVNNLTFTRTIQVNTPGPEDECRFQNARRFTGDFRSGPGALMQRNSQSISPARQEGRDEPSIRTSIHQGPRVQPNKSIKL